MRSYPRNPRKVEKGLVVCDRCRVAMVEKEKERYECPICKVKKNGR